MGSLGQFLDKAQDPPVKAIFVADGNPLTQSPYLQKTVKAFSSIPFKVVFDHFMTDTAIHQGWWHESGAVNFLTDSVISDMGEQAAYYNSFCRIQKID